MNIELLRSRLNYDPETGRLHKHGSRSPFGYIGNDGYRRVRVAVVEHWKCSRVVWSLHNGPIPDGYEIDHIDRDPLNDRIENLRLADPSQNKFNRGGYSNNTSGHKGVTWSKQRGKWHARITAYGKTKHLGFFDDVADAAAAYKAAAAKHFAEFANMG